MAINTAAGEKLYIGPSVTKTAADTLAEISALTGWQEVGEVTNLGELGDEAQDVSFISLSDGRVRHLKGAFDAGTLQTQCGRDPLDAGQIAMAAALAETSEYAFKILYNDKPNSTGTPTTKYFRGLVRSVREQHSGANNVVTIQFNVGINSELFETPAAAGA